MITCSTQNTTLFNLFHQAFGYVEYFTWKWVMVVVMYNVGHVLQRHQDNPLGIILTILEGLGFIKSI